jgi:hypothetical protein
MVFPRTHVLFSIYAGGGGGGWATKRTLFLGKKFANPTIKKSKSFFAKLEYELKNKYPPLAKNFTKGIPFSCHTSHLPVLSHEFDECNFLQSKVQLPHEAAFQVRSRKVNRMFIIIPILIGLISCWKYVIDMPQGPPNRGRMSPTFSVDNKKIPDKCLRGIAPRFLYRMVKLKMFFESLL